MKNKSLFYCLSALLLACMLTALSFGCGKKSVPAGGPVSVEKTSFTEVTSQLDAGGNFYLYLGTAQWLDGLSTKLGDTRQLISSIPNLKPADATNANKVFDLVTRLVKDSGIEDVSGVGLSSVEIEQGLYRNKAVLHHYPGKGTGFLWQLPGREPHALTGLDYLPADTALAWFSDLDVPLLWSVLQKETAQADLPQASKFLARIPAQFEQKTKIKWDTFVNSLGGEFGLVITLDPSNSVPVPLAGSAVLIPTPGLMLAVKVNDDTIFNQIDAELKASKSVISTNQTSVKMRTMPIPLPLIGELRPSAASAGGYLFIASSDALINAALAVKNGQQPGLKASAEFKHLAQGLPSQGNRFIYLSQRFSGVMMQVQQQAMVAGNQAAPQLAQLMQSFQKQSAFAYTVGLNTPEGYVVAGNGSQSFANVAVLPAVAVSGLLAAIAIPNFVQARATAQKNTCINHLRQLDAAKAQWQLEKQKSGTAVPTKEDLMPYLREWPVCPQGGHYILGAVNERPKCSIPGHALIDGQ